ncbi:tyrosine recombinase XerC [Edaphobacillus lindanitolerans]|uniref:tyrosine recombinase XerC n=1 Tax=Edaphobacillus lindanitolerans TaxID=550447 RepID=UPI0038990CFA
MNGRVKDAAEEFQSYIRLERNFSPLTVDGYRKDLEEFFAFLEGEGLGEGTDIRYPEARLFVTRLYDRGLSRATISRKISSLRSFFKFASARYGIDDSAFRSLFHPKKEERLPQFFYEEEMERLFEANRGTSPKELRDLAILELLYATGMRVSEMTGLKVTDPDPSLDIVRVMGKGRRERYIPFGHYAREALETYLAEARPRILKGNKHDRLFVNMKGTPLTDRGIRYILDGMVERAALHSPVHPHMFRHTFATHLLNNGADMRSVQELLGHASLSSTQVYTHVTKDHLRNTYMNAHPRA